MDEEKTKVLVIVTRMKLSSSLVSMNGRHVQGRTRLVCICWLTSRVNIIFINIGSHACITKQTNSIHRNNSSMHHHYTISSSSFFFLLQVFVARREVSLAAKLLSSFFTLFPLPFLPLVAPFVAVFPEALPLFSRGISFSSR